ncbi:hypothetical protein [Sporomusa termitida]|uniref:Uncharacterized protein n=1 Tax=Sporomusa termitida TaxID=2377 RepID=A0A517DUE2_9FIRM|nr:hypothetical protein [Sporomusa termitida]QDR80974.1 hypothetical protein SPTER_23170 [Sporomusa termitida]
MNFKDINNFTIWGLSISAILNLFFLYLELNSQRCGAQEGKEKASAEKKLKDEVAELRKEILSLKNKINTP